MQGKRVVAVAPFNYGINFKMQVYDAWVRMGGETMSSHYPCRVFHKFVFNHELPTIRKSKDIAQLRFVEPVSLSFDTFPGYARYEIIPLIWDCWPRYFEKTCQWFIRHDVRTAIFTSSQNAERMSARFPDMNILTITEGIDTSRYGGGKELRERSVDVLEYGRSNKLFKDGLPPDIIHRHSDGKQKMFLSDDEFFHALGEARITVCLPRCDTQKWLTGDIETLTQRYWEAMLSRMVIIGRAPKELISLIGYNPVIEIAGKNPVKLVRDILGNIEDWQSLVDRNRETALKMGDWRMRINEIRNKLSILNYKL